MKVTGATNQQIVDAALSAGLGCNIENRKGYALVKLLLADGDYHDRYQIINPMSGRRGGAVCYHGHYEWLTQLARIAPSTIVETGRFGAVRYDLSNGSWREKADEYGNNIVGPPVFPYAMREKCDCEA